jgi:hypothetical protein
MRHDDWIARLWETLEAAADRPFFYGACVHLAAECIDAMTGSQWAGSIRSLYADEVSARSLALDGGLERMVTERLGEPVARNLGRMGDAMLLELPTGPAIGICTGPRIACAAERGVLYLRFEHGLKAWRVD